MLEFLRHHSDRAPDRPALSEFTASGWRSVSRAELYRSTLSAAARAAETLKVCPGPAVVELDGSADSVAVLLGLLTARIDVICVEEHSSHLTDASSAIWRTAATAAVLPTARALPSGTPVFDYRELLRGADGASTGGGVAPAYTEAAVDDGAPSVLQLTSGSTGEPRIARHPLGSVLRGAELYRQVHGYHADDMVLLPLPIAHSFGLVGGLFAALVSGTELLSIPKFSLSAVRSGLLRGATVLLGTPLLYQLVEKSLAQALDDGELRVLLSSGGPLAAETARAVQRLSRQPVRQVYGSTETGLIACGTGAEAADSVGRFAPGVEWRLLDAEPGSNGARTGRLAVRTSTMFTGYAGTDGAQTAPGPPQGPDSQDLASGVPSGYYDTGDLVTVSAAGNVSLVGRKNTFINVGGRKVNPRRVERIVREFPGVADAHVLGLDTLHEQAVHAVVVPAPGRAGPHPGDVVAFCRDRLAGYETPHHVHVLPALPRTSMGKIDRTALLAALSSSPATDRSPGHQTDEATL
ncbi:class I adenylate-forming enzyme family protein [Streptomyces sp. NPDC051684]|uniref:class I adenylate-forming enzyme family protein n=1 Tax=Streptomyces sp. NPDC051684 TaxID=3365670 RepID=UPI0037B9D8CB